MNKHTLKIYPGSYLPPAAVFHVCTTKKMPCIDQSESVCSLCATPIFFSDKVPDNLKKICVPCWLDYAKTHDTESVGNVNSLTKAVLAGKRN